MARTTRRDFLKIAGAATAANATISPGWAQASASPELLRVWVTDDVRRMESQTPLRWSRESDPAASFSITLDPEEQHQEILGFGAAFSGSSCFLFHQMAEEARAALFRDLFHPSAMNLNVCRTCIGSADFAVKLYSYDDGPLDPALKNFSIENDRDYVLPTLRQAREMNPSLFLFASPWSPPGWMKDNGTMLGGCMRRTYMASYAKYFVKFLESYAAAGVPIQAVTVQNEVDADQQGLMPACYWPQEYEADFVRLHLGPEFEHSGVKAEIWIIDHNYNLWGRAIAELETPGVRKYAKGVAWHGYSGEPEWMSRVQKAVPGIEMHFTELSVDRNDPEYLTCWVPWAQKLISILNHSCRSVTLWCFATDETGRPNIGPYPGGGMLTVDSKTRTAYHSGQYFAMGHFSRFVRRGAVRIGSRSTTSTVQHCAFHNPDRSIVTVISNPGVAQNGEVQLYGKSAQLTLPANSVVTIASAANLARRTTRGERLCGE